MSTTTQIHTFTNARDLRYGEIFLVTDQGIDMYNTTGLNDCPDALWNALDIQRIKEQHEARAVMKNGPHWWVADTVSVELGETREFDGLEARWIGRLPLAMAQAEGAGPYQVFQPKKSGAFVYARGRLVYELVSPDNDAFVMQAYGRVVDSTLTLDALATLGEQLKLAPGWAYRARNLDQDLKLSLGNTTVYAVSDDLRNIYNRT